MTSRSVLRLITFDKQLRLVSTRFTLYIFIRSELNWVLSLCEEDKSIKKVFFVTHLWQMIYCSFVQINPAARDADVFAIWLTCCWLNTLLGMAASLSFCWLLSLTHQGSILKCSDHSTNNYVDLLTNYMKAISRYKMPTSLIIFRKYSQKSWNSRVMIMSSKNDFQNTANLCDQWEIAYF